MDLDEILRVDRRRDIHAKHGCETYVCSDISDAARVSSSLWCNLIRVGADDICLTDQGKYFSKLEYHIANVYKPPTKH